MKADRSTRTPCGPRSEGGAAAVEMAIVLPILVLLVFGIVEFGFVFNRWTTVTHAAREGVRQYALGVSAADAELFAEAAAPDLGTSVDCIASQPSLGEVQMLCQTTYDFSLYIFTAPIEVSSTARMRKE